MESPRLGVGNRSGLSNTEGILGYGPMHLKRGSGIRVRLYPSSNGARVVIERDTDEKMAAMEETGRKGYRF